MNFEVFKWSKEVVWQLYQFEIKKINIVRKRPKTVVYIWQFLLTYLYYFNMDGFVSVSKGHLKEWTTKKKLLTLGLKHSQNEPYWNLLLWHQIVD